MYSTRRAKSTGDGKREETRKSLLMSLLFMKRVHKKGPRSLSTRSASTRSSLTKSSLTRGSSAGSLSTRSSSTGKEARWIVLGDQRRLDERGTSGG